MASPNPPGQHRLKLLLDTDCFLFAALAPERMSASARAALVDPASQRLLSAVSVWEMAIKASMGKLELVPSVDDVVSAVSMDLILELLSFTSQHASAIRLLPFIHNDPFDRALVAQARIEGAALVTSDPIIRRYDVEVIW